MKVTTVARTQIVNLPDEVKNTEFHHRIEIDADNVTDIDLLGEMAGRSCYKSWTLPNPATQTNDGYMGNIQDHAHYSVMEHGTVTFWVEGVSRALLLELERHRHISFSVESQRYVNTRKFHPTPIRVPLYSSNVMGDEGVILQKNLDDHYHNSLDLYDKAYNLARDKGVPIKEAREAARAYLPESTPVDLFVSGNMRAWRDVLGKRFAEGADAEIREFAGKILGELRIIAPHTFQDISDEPTPY